MTVVHRGRARRALIAAATLLSLAVSTPPARAGVPDPDAARIVAAGHSLKWNWTPPGRAGRYGHAETLIRAPVDVVRGHVLDFARYHEMLPSHFKTSRIVGHTADRSTDVYIQISVLHGVIALWDVARFSAPRTLDGGVEIVEGRMIPGRGNVQDMDVVWTLRALDEQWTVLKFDLLLKPGLPAPQSIMDGELRDAANTAVDSIRDRAQGARGIARWPDEG